jgi:Fe-S cluster assembly protein SufD
MTMTLTPPAETTPIYEPSSLDVATLLGMNLTTALSPFEASVEPLLQAILANTATDSSPLQQLKSQSAERFMTLGLPNRKKQEPWKFIDLKPLVSKPLPAVQSHIEPCRLPYRLEKALKLPVTLTVCNGNFPKNQSPQAAAPWVLFSQLEPAKQADFQHWLAEKTSQEADPFCVLGQALAENIWILDVPANTTIEKPLVIYVNQSQTSMAFPQWAVRLAENATATIVVSCSSEAQLQAYVQACATVELAKGSTLNWVYLVNHTSENVVQLLNTRATIHEKAHFNLFAVNASNGALLRHSMDVVLVGQEANATLNGITLATGKTSVHNHVRLTHDAENCQSSQIFKAVVGDEAKSEFDGSIFVTPNGQQTDAKQLSKNMLLSNKAKAFARPWLKIDADDVKCSHGTTVGQLDEQQVFYLVSRGIAPEEARHMLTLAFVVDLLSQLENVAGIEALKAECMTLFQEKLAH